MKEKEINGSTEDFFSIYMKWFRNQPMNVREQMLRLFVNNPLYIDNHSKKVVSFYEQEHLI